METFWLGVHRPNWLATLSVPLFVSHQRLRTLKRLPRAIGPWALDSGAFTEVSTHGRFTTTPRDYAKAVQRYRDEIGGMVWAAPQDWMVEPWILEKTGLTVEEHQRRTVENYLALRDLGADVIPVLQGWVPDAYLRHVEQYDRTGVDLTALPVVGIGSVCRRQRMAEGREIVGRLARLGIRLHGFGVKVTGLRDVAHQLVSADSMAWSLRARRGGIRLPGCTHKRCANCPRWALVWRARVLRAIAEPKQEALW